MKDKRYKGFEFANIPIISGNNNGTILLGDIAEIVEGFEDSDITETFNGEKGLTIRVYRVGTQTPNSISDAVKEVVEDTKLKIPEKSKK